MDKGVKKTALELQPCCRNRSGVGLFTYELAKRLNIGNNTQYYGNVFNFLGRNDNSKAFEGIKMPIRECRMFPYGVYRRAWDFLPFGYEKMFPDADLNIFFNYIVPPRVPGKVVTVVYDMTYLRFPETMDKRNLRRLREGMKRSISRSDRIVTISEFTKKEITELLNVPKEKVSIVYCAPSLSDNSADWEIVHRKYAVEKPYLLYVGTIEPRKNLERLLKAFELLKKNYNIPHKLVLAGGKGWKSEGIYQTANTLSCYDDVIFTGYISADEKNTLYQNASAFVYPSLYEGFGMPPLEAMSFGCPVVCSNVASLPEVVGEAAHPVDPYDIENIAAGIFRVLSDAEYRENLIIKAQTQVKKFTWDESARQLMNICEEILEES